MDQKFYGCASLGVIWRVWRGHGPCPGCGERGDLLSELVDGTEDFAPEAHVDLRALGLPVERLKDTAAYRRAVERNAPKVA